MSNFSDNSDELNSESCFNAENEINETDFDTNLTDFDTDVEKENETDIT